jgi:hypothetical protein
MISKLFDIVLNFVTKTIGTTLTVIIVVFALGIYVAVSYPISNYLVTPETLQQSEQRTKQKVDSVYTKLDKSSATNKINIIEIQLDNLQRERSDLEDKIDVPRPKARHIQRLKEVNKYIDTLVKSKKESMNILETK